MGTRSRIILLRKTKSDVHLWMHWDGYFAGQGNELCNQLRLLLSKYSNMELDSMLEALDIEDLDLSTESQNFSAEFLSDFMEGHVSYKNDECNDIEYEYIVDFMNGLVFARNGQAPFFVVQFAAICNGFKMEELNTYLDHPLYQ